MNKLITFGSVFVAGLGLGFMSNAFFAPAPSQALSALQDGEAYVAQVFALGTAPVTDDWCAGNENELPDDYRVADFMHDYVIFFADEEGERYSRFIPCGERADNTCGISYGERNAEGDKGYSRTLWFDVSPDSNQIIPGSFVCMGL